MTNVIDLVESPIVLQLHPVIEMTEDEFFEFCQLNRDLCIERTAWRSSLTWICIESK
jgi:hypothetical protein